MGPSLTFFRAKGWAWKGGTTPAEGRAESVPEAGGTGAGGGGNGGHAARRSRRRTHSRNRRSRPAVIGGRREQHIRRLDAGNVRPSRWPGGLPNRERCRSGGFPGGSKGGGSTPRQSANVLHRVCWLSHLSVAQASAAAAREDTPARRPGRRWPCDRKSKLLGLGYPRWIHRNPRAFVY